MANIIFGVFNNYNSIKTSNGGIYYFMKTLRKYNTSCKVIILTQHINEELRQFSEETDFEIYTDFIIPYNIVLYRFLVYKSYLEQSQITYENILLSDIDDVIFQDDPFSIQYNEDLYCACENNMLSGSNWSSKLNMAWIDECILPETDNTNYINQHVICAGTILGSYKSIKTYLEFYANAYSIKVTNDQGLLNVYVYNFLDSKSIKPYQKSRILTLDGINFENLKFDSSKYVINHDGERYAIIHQINRCNREFFFDLAIRPP